MSLRLKLLNAYLRYFERPGLARTVGAQAGRDRLERNARMFFGDTPGIRCAPVAFDDAGHLTGQVVRPISPRADAAILFLHGGGFTFGSSETHRRLAARIADQTGLEVFLPDYRLSPEHVFPAALDDCHAAYRYLLDRGYAHVVLMGDSAGGGLVFSLLGRVLKRGEEVPLAAIGLSPWGDLTQTSDALRRNDATEVTLPTERLADVAAAYRGSVAADDPEVSPIFAGYKGAPPCLIHVSDCEIFLDDAHALETALRRDGADVVLRTWEKTPHVWHIHHRILPEARDAIADIGQFVKQTLAATLKR